MSTKKKTVKIEEKEPVIIEEKDILTEEEVKPEVEASKVKIAPKKAEKEPKYKIGSIVYVSKDADADLNGFKLFPQYKKYTYTVEAYDAKLDVYSLRRLNLSLKLKECNIIAPDERAHDSLNRRQF